MLDIRDSSQVKLWLSENKVLFVTNSTLRPGGTFMASLLTYADDIPMHNFALIPGVKTQIDAQGRKSEAPNYGFDVFDEMTKRAMTDIIWKQFDYAIYIDDDCFIADFSLLIELFIEFMHSGCCLAGPLDGGVFSHRNHSGLLINTFLSFWNLKLMREKTTVEKFHNTMVNIHKSGRAYEMFLEMLPDELSNKMIDSANKVCECMRKYRLENFPIKRGNDAWTDYAVTVTDDKDNLVEPHQTPYSSKIERTNFEPYYVVEEAWVLLTSCPIYYFYATDYYDSSLDNEETDNSGLTSCVFGINPDGEQPDGSMSRVAYHTWFSRAYSKFPMNELMLKHTLRINKIISNL